MSSGPIGGNTGLTYYATFKLEGKLTQQELDAVVKEIQTILKKPKHKGSITSEARLNSKLGPPVTNVRIG